tara:strand:+ start:13995 stop:14216 length:222 start_codon:yes stop_codon:yes gene_type:complete
MIADQHPVEHIANTCIALECQGIALRYDPAIVEQIIDVTAQFVQFALLAVKQLDYFNPIHGRGHMQLNACQGF